MKREILTLSQIGSSIKKELTIQDIRSLGHLLNGIEFFHKVKLYYSDDIVEFGNYDLKKKHKIYHDNYRITISRINKNSPLEIDLIIKGLAYSIDVIDLMFSEEKQEDTLKRTIEKICSLDFNNENHDKLWKQFYNYYRNCKKIIKVLNLVVKHNND